MTARKIRMTSVGLVAMPADRDERTVCADDVARDPALWMAYTELAHRADYQHTCMLASLGRHRLGRAVTKAWDAAVFAAIDNDELNLRLSLERARDAAVKAGSDTTHEDAALAMLPPVAGRRAA